MSDPSEPSTEMLRAELARHIETRDAILEEAWAAEGATFTTESQEYREVKRAEFDRAMERLYRLNFEVIWPLEAEIKRREGA